MDRRSTAGQRRIDRPAAGPPTADQADAAGAGLVAAPAAAAAREATVSDERRLHPAVAAARFVAAQADGASRLLDAHFRRDDGYCGGCAAVLTHWPCGTALIARAALTGNPTDTRAETGAGAAPTGRGSLADRLTLSDDWDSPEVNAEIARDFGVDGR